MKTSSQKTSLIAAENSIIMHLLFRIKNNQYLINITVDLGKGDRREIRR